MAHLEEDCTSCLYLLYSCISVFSLKNKTKKNHYKTKQNHTNPVTFPSLAEKKNKTGTENQYPNDPL